MKLMNGFKLTLRVLIENSPKIAKLDECNLKEFNLMHQSM